MFLCRSVLSYKIEFNTAASTAAFSTKTFCMLRCFLAVLFVGGSLLVFGQSPSKIQQLKSSIISAKSTDEKLKALFAFCDEWDCYSPDTLKKYSEEASQLAGSGSNHDRLVADYYKALWLLQVNKLDSSSNLVNALLKRYQKEFPYDDMTSKMYALRGNILLRTAKMDELLSLDYEWLKLTEQNKDTFGMARAITGIGNVDSRLKKYDAALRSYHQALGLAQNPSLKRRLSFLYNNIAVVFYHLNKEDSAMYYVLQGVELSREDGNLTNLANALSLQGGLLAEYKHLPQAETVLKEEIEVRKQIGDVYYLIADIAQMALFYSNTKTPEKGIALCKEALVIAEKNGNDFQSLNSIYSSMAKCYEAAGDYKGYSEAILQQSSLKDSIYQRSSTEAMAEMQTKYDLQKKENTIIQQKLELVSKNYLLYGSLALLLLGVVASYIIFKQYRKKQRLKMQLMQEEEKRRSEKAVADAEEAERKRIAADLHDSLGAYAASIAANIDHLRLSHQDPSGMIALQELRANSMAIVSQLSDTIWALKKDALSLTTISDRIKIFVQRIQSSYPDITIDVFEKINTDHLLAPSQAFHLFQIMKEAINNALRHSGCNYLSVAVRGDRNWRIDITDNGQGMKELTITEGGNGLLNMRTRAKESGWKIEWQKNQPKGTQVIIEPTTN